MWNRIKWADVDVYNHNVSEELMNYKMKVILDSYQLFHDWCLHYKTYNVRH